MEADTVATQSPFGEQILFDGRFRATVEKGTT
ncbi:MAG: hypothetical protein QOG64_2859, partial [Acidimicrobiaceae bacterium]|nr:hypothetical protein [Acidimicrobiaceae bacterium]